MDAEKTLAVTKKQHNNDECQIYKYEQYSLTHTLGKIGQAKLLTAQKADMHDHGLLNEAEAKAEALGGPEAPPKHSTVKASTSLGPHATITKAKCS